MRLKILFIFILFSLLFVGFYYFSVYDLHLEDNIDIDIDNIQIEKEKIVETQPKILKLIFGGDVMFDRNVRKMGEKNGYDSFFVDIATLLHSADLVVVNLEGPITENKSKTLLGDGSLTKSYSFTFSTTTAGAMSRAGIGAVSLANNHMDNMSFQGFVETKKWLNENFISYFGDPWNSTSTELLYDSDGFRLAFVGYHGFQSGLANILSDISRLSREGYFVIVMPHWGEEYIEVNTPKMKEFAEAFISSGAKAIFGSHPHVVLNNEWIGEVPVFYSLGNLLFDQYWNDRVTNGQLVAMYLRLDEGEIVIDNMEIYDTSIKSRKKIELL